MNKTHTAQPKLARLAIRLACIAIGTAWQMTAYAEQAPLTLKMAALSGSPTEIVQTAAQGQQRDRLGAFAKQFVTDGALQDIAGQPNDPLEPGLALMSDDPNIDLWDRLRQGYGLPELDSPLVAQHENFYATRPAYVQRMTERANRYLYHILLEVKKRGMPNELALLPFVESAFNPTAKSSAKASGIWQFMPATGRDFSLKQNIFRDDRRDVLASTRAALDYLSRLHRQFGDWHLALAAYNWGEGNVQRAINRNAEQGLPTDYLSLSMPAETRHYVPKLHAMRNIVLNPQQFGLSLTPIENHPYFLSVPIKRDMDVSVAARLAEISLEDFKDLNPSMNKPVILAAGTPQILLPYTNTGLFLDNLAQYKGSLASLTAWVAPRTMKTAEAAQHVGMSEPELRALNKIPPRMLVKAGSTLLVPRSESRVRDVSEQVADNAMISLAPDIPPLTKLTIRAGKRDSVKSLAKRYRLSASEVARWNNTSVGGKFKKRQQVVIYVPTGGKLHESFADKPSRKTASKRDSQASRSAKSSDRKATRSAKASASKNKKVAKASGRASKKSERVASAKSNRH